jgi:hypothetical protein
MFPSNLVPPDSSPQFEFLSRNLRRSQSTPIPVSPPGNPEKQRLVSYNPGVVPANSPFSPTDKTATQTGTSTTNTGTPTNMALSSPHRMASAPPSSSSAMSDYERRARRKRGQLAAIYGSNVEDSETATTSSLVPSNSGPLTPSATMRTSAPMTVAMGHQSLPDLEELYEPALPDSTSQFEFVSSNQLRRIKSTPTPVFPPGKPRQQQQQLGSHNQLVVPANLPFPTTESATTLTGTSTANTTMTLSHPGPGHRTLSAPMTDYERRAQRKRGQMAAMYGNNAEDTASATTLRLASANTRPLTPPLPSATVGTSAPMTVPIIRQSLPDLEEPHERATTSPPRLSETTDGSIRRMPSPRPRDNCSPESINSCMSSGSLASLDGSADELAFADGASRGSRDRTRGRPRRRRQQPLPPSSDDDTASSLEFGIEVNNDIRNSSTLSPWGMGAGNVSANNIQQFHQSVMSEATWCEDDTVGELQDFAVGNNHHNHNQHDFQLPPMSADHDSTMPGAFHARGRAIGEYPAWGRRGGPGGATMNPEGPNGNRQSLQSSGSSRMFLRSNMLSRLSSRWRSSLGIHQHDVGVVEARLVSEAESNPSQHPADGNSPQSVHGEMQVLDADNVVTDESIRLKRERFCLLSMLACLALALIQVVVILRFTTGALRPGRDDGMDPDNPDDRVGNVPIVPVFPTNETIAFEEWCGGFKEHFATVHSPAVQCLCTENLETIPAATLLSFQGFAGRLDSVGVFDSATSNTDGYPDGTNCDDPRNGALYWLAEEEPGFARYSSQTLVERYSLAVLFMSTKGIKWKEQKSWLTQMDVCDWGGITCHNLDDTSSRDGGGLIMSIDLSNHGLSGIIPPDLAFLEGLEVLNLADNVDLVGTVPATFAQLDRLSTLDIRGTSVDVVDKPNVSLSQSWCAALPSVTVEADCGMACDCCRGNC